VAEGCKNVFCVTLRPFSDACEGKMCVRIGIPETERHTKTTFCTRMFHGIMGRFKRTSRSVFLNTRILWSIRNVTYYKHKKDDHFLIVNIYS
jgi:hypothetical protein